MDATAFKPTHIKPSARKRARTNKAGCREGAGLVVSGATPIPGPLIAPTVMECTVGESRRCMAHHEAHEIMPGVFQVFPKFVRVIGGGPDLLRGRLEAGQAIPGRFAGLEAAYAAAVAWTTAFNEVAD